MLKFVTLPVLGFTLLVGVTPVCSIPRTDPNLLFNAAAGITLVKPSFTISLTKFGQPFLNVPVSLANLLAMFLASLFILLKIASVPLFAFNIIYLLASYFIDAIVSGLIFLLTDSICDGYTFFLLVSF